MAAEQPSVSYRTSAEGFAVLGEMFGTAQRPRVLYEAFKSGRVPHTDMAELIAFAWLRDDQPTSDIGEEAWLEIFCSAGFVSYPQPRRRPDSPVTVYRASTADRIRRMSWAETPEVAVILGTRHAWYGNAALYQAPVEPEEILAYLHREGEGWTVVVNSAALGDIRFIRELPDPRPKLLNVLLTPITDVLCVPVRICLLCQ